MDGCIRASGFVLYSFVFVAGLSKHDFSRRTRSAENSDALVAYATVSIHGAKLRPIPVCYVPGEP